MIDLLFSFWPSMTGVSSKLNYSGHFGKDKTFEGYGVMV